jgi:glycogen debranching enzyme
MQPPLLAEAVQAAARGEGGAAFLAEVLPAVRRYYDWLDRVRDPDRDGLVATLQPDESGLDHAPKYDAYLGISSLAPEEFTAAWGRVAGPYAEVGRDPDRMFGLDLFVVEDVLVNTIYAENESVLAELLERTGDTGGAEEMRRRARRSTTALVEKCYDRDAGLFFDLAGAEEETLRTNSISSLMPLLLPDLPAPIAATLIDHLEDPREYSAPFPVPSVAMNVPSFSPGPVGTLVWRGPSWMNTNWYLSRGLRRHGRIDLASVLEDRSARLVEEHGFREYYNPLTGVGAGARDFSWTGIVVDMLARREGEA